MSRPAEPNPNLIALVLAVLANEAAPEDCDRLNRMVLSDPSLVGRIVELVGQEAWLGWKGGPDQSRNQTSRSSQRRYSETRVSNSLARLANEWPNRPAQQVIPRHFAPARWLGIAAVLLVFVGAVLGTLATRFVAVTPPPIQIVDHRFPQHSIADMDSGYVGRIINVSACHWSSDSISTLESGGSLRRGESLNLLEGVAEVRLDRFNGTADLKLEGPAGLVVTASGGCSLSHGKITGEVTPTNEVVCLDTPNGRMNISQSASFGVSVSGGEVAVHVFKGAASFVVPWSAGNSETQAFELHRGDSLTLRRESSGRVTVSRGASQPALFISRTSMQSDQLQIPDEYVRDVLDLKPVLYWRFDDCERGIVKNANGEAYCGLMEGKIYFRHDGDNQSIDFRSGFDDDERDSYIVSDQPLQASLEDGYSIEMWVKPSHYHSGTIAALVGEADEPDIVPAHGMVLELGGPYSTWPWIEHPGKVRFLHRSPPGESEDIGASCFSSSPYGVRRWQHVVAVKDRHSLRLYMDGRLTAAAEDDTPLSAKLLLLVGQMDTFREQRLFVGQLDELAFYAKPLSEDVIRRHYELVKLPTTPAKIPELGPGI